MLYIYICICIYICIYILKFEITPNTTSKLLVDWMFIDDICEHDRLVSAFDCLLHIDSYIDGIKKIMQNDTYFS